MIIGLKTRQFYRDFLTAKQVLEVTMEIVDGILNKTQKNYNAWLSTWEKSVLFLEFDLQVQKVLWLNVGFVWHFFVSIL